MAKAKNKKLSLEELLEEAIVKEEDRPYEVPENWVWTSITNLFENLTSSNKKIKKKDYLTEGDYAIVDQGKELVGGYSTDRNLIFDGELPVVVFGDHTRIVKYIDFPFIQGADGVKVLKALSGVYDKFFFYLLKNIEIPDLGYRRHFPLFSSLICPLPPLPEQQRIVEIIESLFVKLDAAKEMVQNALDSFENRKAAILHKAFTGELTSKWREENSVSLESWKQVIFEELIKTGPQNGLYKPQTAYGQGCMIVRIDNFYDGTINPWYTLKRLLLEESEEENYGLKNDDIIINRVNSIQYLGKSALVRNLEDSCVFESNVMRLTLTEDAIPEYIIRYLNSNLGLRELRKNAKHAVNQASINQTDVKNVIVIIPSIEEQQEIVRILDNLLGNEQRAKELCDVIEKIDLMKKAILAKAFRGELGTNNPEEESAFELLKEVLKEKL
ncbi:restriction endonuclease subunit S [Clostridium coskatii]|uniref:Type-1 restriction enzyme EcoKI specificity protein n=1 Tax=Clostridium coskatii TaxID=1705578 RepID=A0A162KX99_9CLOT|nr:restriction endonuclease subunit S [Clostridium coskatii]OAA85396.1 Type-1 restriction enzyme EcoKI specificity protein [Clostridium coskatii]OBR91370.1 type-1 restriction enzyme EcoKI specificity protein [Clostridium coskatii]